MFLSRRWKNVDDSFDKKKAVSEFNEASYQILRLHNLWTNCNSYSTRGMLIEWKWTLDRVWIELSADSDKKKGHAEKIRLLNLKIAELKNPVELYDGLQEKEIFLRALQEEVGKGSKKVVQYDKIM